MPSCAAASTASRFVAVRNFGAAPKPPWRGAARAGHALPRFHVDLVDVGALLAIDLDRDDRLVHEPCDVRVLERLAFHHVTPVTRRVADRDQHRLVLAARALPRLVAPREPVDGVVRVLPQVRARLVREPVTHTDGRMGTLPMLRRTPAGGRTWSNPRSRRRPLAPGR